MATAPTQLDTMAQQLADKVMDRVSEKLEKTVTESVDKAVDAKMEEQSKKTADQIDAKVTALKTAEKTASLTLRQWSTTPQNHPYTPVANPADLGLRGARIIRAYAAVKGDMDKVPKFIRDTLKDKECSALAEKSLETGTPSKGGILTLDEFLAGEFYPLLRESFSVMDLGARVVPMPQGNLHIVGLESGTSVGWVGETKKGTTSRPAFGRRKLSSKKAFGNVALTNDLLEEASYAVDEIVRQDLIEALTEVLLSACLHGSGSSYTPLGIDKDPLRTQVTVGSMLTADHPPAFITKLMKAKVKFDPSNAAWIFGPDVWSQYYNLKTTTGAYIFREEMDKVRLLGYPFRVVSTVEVGVDAHGLTHQFFGKWSELYIGVTRDISVEMSREATVVDEDGNTINAWEEDLTFIKMTHKCDMALRLAKAMAHSNDTYTIT